MAYDVQTAAIEPIIDGMIDLLKVNLVAHTFLTHDAHIGDTILQVDNSVRFRKFDYVLLMDNNSSQASVSGDLNGVEFHQVARDFQGTGILYLSEPLQKDFLVSNNARFQKAIKKALLYEKDILYGDRQVINSTGVAICVEPVSKSQDWLAVRLLGSDNKLNIMVYVKCGGLGDEEEYAMRVCNSYADAINQLLLGNIHLDISIDETPLVRDAQAGDKGVYIACNVADDWLPGIECLDYEVQDNWGADQLLKIVETGSGLETSSSSSITSLSSSRLGGSSSSKTSSTSFLMSESSKSSSSSSLSSSSSWSSQSVFVQESSSLTSDSSSSSSPTSDSSWGGSACWVELDRPLYRSYKVADKAVLRRKKRYTYDSRVDNIEYGTVQKGSVFLKAARVSWFGKEAESFVFPQPGLGRQT